MLLSKLCSSFIYTQKKVLFPSSVAVNRASDSIPLNFGDRFYVFYMCVYVLVSNSQMDLSWLQGSIEVLSGSGAKCISFVTFIQLSIVCLLCHWFSWYFLLTQKGKYSQSLASKRL
uniref:Uncharacterized protein n=1 Tax=Micrurus spixii TaxID=129469 RepID=A0A2D4LIX1_9SAUR